MKTMQCKICGGTIEFDGEKGICQNCGMVYTQDALKKIVVELNGAVDVNGVDTARSIVERARVFEKTGEYNKAFSILDDSSSKNPEYASVWQEMLHMQEDILQEGIEKYSNGKVCLDDYVSKNTAGYRILCPVCGKVFSWNRKITSTTPPIECDNCHTFLGLEKDNESKSENGSFYGCSVTTTSFYTVPTDFYTEISEYVANSVPDVLSLNIYYVYSDRDLWNNPSDLTKINAVLTKYLKYYKAVSNDEESSNREEQRVSEIMAECVKYYTNARNYSQSLRDRVTEYVEQLNSSHKEKLSGSHKDFSAIWNRRVQLKEKNLTILNKMNNVTALQILKPIIRGQQAYNIYKINGTLIIRPDSKLAKKKEVMERISSSGVEAFIRKDGIIAPKWVVVVEPPDINGHGTYYSDGNYEWWGNQSAIDKFVDVFGNMALARLKDGSLFRFSLEKPIEDVSVSMNEARRNFAENNPYLKQ